MLPKVASGRKKARALFVDGKSWLVYELSDDGRREPSLVFENENLVRLVRTYPTSWRNLTDVELVELKETR
jgi:hypothetical protein